MAVEAIEIEFLMRLANLLNHALRVNTKKIKKWREEEKNCYLKHKFVSFFRNLRSFGIFIQPNVVVNLTSSIDIFLRSLGSTLFFREWIFTASNNAWQPFSALSSSLPTRLGQSRTQIKTFF